MPRIILGVARESPTDDLRNDLFDHGYRVLITEGCDVTRSSTSKEPRGRVATVVLDSRLVAASLRNDEPTDIITDLHENPDVRVLVFMTMPFARTSGRVQEAVLRSDAVVDAPASPSGIRSRLSSLLQQPKYTTA